MTTVRVKAPSEEIYDKSMQGT